MRKVLLLLTQRAALRWWQFLLSLALIVFITVILVSRPFSFHKHADPMSIELIEKFAKDKDAKIRALAILALSRHKINDPMSGALIHQALLDKDPLVQKAAKLVIEDNFGIQLKSGAEGIHQAHELINDVGSAALLIKKDHRDRP